MALGLVMRNMFHLIFRDVNKNNLRFTFNGRRISNIDTPTSLGMVNAIEEVMVEEIEGKSI